MLGAFTVRVPPDGWKPPAGRAAEQKNSMITSANVDGLRGAQDAQFYFLWTVLFCNVTAGIGILEQASPMIQDFFAGVSPAQAAGYVGLLSLCNMTGRFVWSSTSDIIGRKPTYMLYSGGRRPLLFVASIGTSSIAVFVALTG
jgi:fucose permease